MKRHEIWKSNVKFEDEDAAKPRPVLIWNDTTMFVIAYKMTGTNRGDDREEYRVEHWQESGLEKPTSIRIRKVLRLNHDELIEKMGELDYRDRLRFELRIAG